MTTFAERKAARKASGNRKFVFEVRDSFYGQLVRTFESRKQAEQDGTRPSPQTAISFITRMI